MSGAESECNHGDESGRGPPQRPTPLPKLQLFIINLIQFTEPITATIIYPFVAKLVTSTGMTGGDETKVGYFAGMIESAFFLAEFLTVYPWSLLSNKLGRRPVVLIGPLGLALSTLGFGLTSNFYALLVIRAVQGLCNGNLGVSKTMIAEITDATNMNLAYSFIPLMWSTGVTAGPLLGGLLASPAERWELFSRGTFFKKHPYFLACAVASVIAFIAFLFGLFGLKESSKIARPRQSQKPATVPSDDSETRYLLPSPPSSYGSTLQPEEEEEAPPRRSSEEVYSFSKLLAIPRFFHTLTCHSLLCFVEMAYTSLLPIIYSTSPANGGLGLQPQQIGAILATVGCTSAVLAIWVVQPLVTRFGPKVVYIGSMIGIGLAFMMLPMMTFFVRRAGRVDAPTIVCMTLQLTFGMSISASYATIQTLLADASPNHASLSSVFSVGQMAACVARIISPTVATSLYSLSISKQLLGGNLVFLILVVVDILGVWNALGLDGELKMMM